MSQGGAAYFAGKGVKNGDQQASIAGAVAAAHFIRSVAPSYEIPVVLHTGTSDSIASYRRAGSFADAI